MVRRAASLLVSVLAVGMADHDEEVDPREAACAHYEGMWYASNCTHFETEPVQCNGGDLYGADRACSADGCKVLLIESMNHSCAEYCGSFGFTCAGAAHVAEHEDEDECSASVFVSCETAAVPGRTVCECAGQPDAARQTALAQELTEAAPMCAGVLMGYLGCLDEAGGGDDLMFMAPRVMGIHPLLKGLVETFGITEIGDMKLSASDNIVVKPFGEDPRDAACSSLYSEWLSMDCGNFQHEPVMCNDLPLYAAEEECGGCKVEVQAIYYENGTYTCAGYCSWHGLECVAAWEVAQQDGDNDCMEQAESTCDAVFATELDGTRAICECGGQADYTTMYEAVMYLQSIGPSCAGKVGEYMECLGQYQDSEILFYMERLTQALGAYIRAGMMYMGGGGQPKCGRMPREMAYQLGAVQCGK